MLCSGRVTSVLWCSGAGPFGVFSCVLDGVERQQSHRAVYRWANTQLCSVRTSTHDADICLSSVSGCRFVPRHVDELQLETDDPVLMLKQSEDLWCQGYNMRTGATGIFPAFYAVKVPKDPNHGMQLHRTNLSSAPSEQGLHSVLLSCSPERRLVRAVRGAVSGFGSGPDPYGWWRTECSDAEGTDSLKPQDQINVLKSRNWNWTAGWRLLC